MKTTLNRSVTTLVCLLFIAITAQAQRNDWMTDNADAQRTATIRSDAKINKDSVAKPGAVQLLWKLKLKNTPRGLNNLTPPSTLERLIGYRGFRMLGFVAGSDNNLFAIDTDLGRLEWEKHLNLPASSSASGTSGTLACPGGMTTSIVRPTLAAIVPGGAGSSPGRSQPAKSSVGDAGEGATTLKNVRPPQTVAPPPTAPRPSQPRPNQPPAGGGFGGLSVIYAVGSDGRLYSLHLSNGAEYQSPVNFLPPGANASGFIIVNSKAYAVTSQSCNGAANGLWSYDFETQKVASWKGNIAGSVGAALGGDGTVYIATGAGESMPNSIVALDQDTLQPKGSYKANAEFTSSPVIFEHKGKILIAAATADGSLHLVDTANLSSALSVTPATAKGAAPGALASFVDGAGTRWVLVAQTARKGAIQAYKVSDDGKLASGWTSRELVSPLTPTIINGVVIATSSGEVKSADNKLTAARSGKAVVYLLDGTTGKELWNSGTTVASFARGNALSGGMGQFYLTTYDGTLYAFGFPIEH